VEVISSWPYPKLLREEGGRNSAFRSSRRDLKGFRTKNYRRFEALEVIDLEE